MQEADLFVVRTMRTGLGWYSSRLSDPADKLWFMKRTLMRFAATPELLRGTPIVRAILFHYAAVESLGELLSNRRAEVALPRKPLLTLYFARRPLLGLALIGVGWGAYLLGAFGYGAASAGADWLFSRLVPPPAVASSVAPASPYPTARISEVPKAVWLVSEGGDEELWSNGLRISTMFETRGEPRQFFAFPVDGAPPLPMGDDPVGIVYHATESDMAPLAQEFNRDIVETTRDLVGWLSRRAVYHYIIDRFGQVYRIVDDDTVAVHAGASIWADDEYFYIGLNESFIGVAFESRWSAGGDIVTPAQLASAVNLTDLLRARYRIKDANCVPHGLVSVNGSKRLIGYHADWARNFPFGALGLENKYEVPVPSVADFGFGYDDDLLARLGGKLWPGVALAEEGLRLRAEADSIPVAALRSRLQNRYRELVELAKIMRVDPPGR